MKMQGSMLGVTFERIYEEDGLSAFRRNILDLLRIQVLYSKGFGSTFRGVAQGFLESIPCLSFQVSFNDCGTELYDYLFRSRNLVGAGLSPYNLGCG
jgi:hypothetical protein